MIRIDADFRNKRRRREELHFDAVGGYEVVGGGERSAEECEGKDALHGAGMRVAVGWLVVGTAVGREGEVGR